MKRTPEIQGNAFHCNYGLTFIMVLCVQENVFVTVVASAQYRCHAESAEDAVYKLSNPTEYIKAYVYDGKKNSLAMIMFCNCMLNL